MSRGATTMLVLATALLGAGCIEDLDPASLVKGTRPIAARVVVAGDPAVATPEPGEAAEVEFLVASPGDLPPLAWGFVLCPGVVTSTGDALCAGEPFAFSLQEEPVGSVPVIDFTVPAGFEADRVVGLGVICAESAPILDVDGQDVGCEEGGAETLIRFDIDVVGGDEPDNLNPGLAAVTFDGADWEPPPPGVPETGCAGLGLPTVRADGDDVVIDFDSGTFVRDRFERFDGEEVTEDIVIFHFATAGEFERLLSVVDDDDPEAEVDWTPPTSEEPVDPSGERIRFWFVFRDDRGGVSWLSRDVCLVP